MTGIALRVSNLDVRYASAHVVQDVSLEIPTGSLLAVLGRNGVGKTSLVHGICGLARPSAGSVLIAGREMAARRPYEIARAGLGLVPQGRRVFGPLTVHENLRLAARPGAWDIPRVLALLPVLDAKRTSAAMHLSGGQQQMLALGRALCTNPRLLVLDEPSEGLSPRAVDDLADALSMLRRDGMSMLLVEQRVDLALELADDVAEMTAGRITFRGTTADYNARPTSDHAGTPASPGRTFS